MILGFWTRFATVCYMPSLILTSQSDSSIFAKQEREISFNLLFINELPLKALPAGQVAFATFFYSWSFLSRRLSSK